MPSLPAAGVTLGFLRHPPAASFPTLDEAERAHIVKALEQCGWRVSGERGAAKLLEFPATTLESRIKHMGLTRPS